jgi:hypothetical protein
LRITNNVVFSGGVSYGADAKQPGGRRHAVRAGDREGLS